MDRSAIQRMIAEQSTTLGDCGAINDNGRVSMLHPLRFAAYLWASPYTLAGLAIGLMLGGRCRWVSGVVEIHGRGVTWLLEHLPVSAAAMTMGHTVLGRNLQALDRTRRHERVHVRQFERWGVLMGPAYVAASVYMYARGRDFYRDNPFEVEAYRTDVG